MSKWSVLEKLIQDVRKKEGHEKKLPEKKVVEDELINQWMTISKPVPEKEKNLLENLKDRMKAKQDLEKSRLMEIEKRRKEKEDQELFEKKRTQAREEEERERERKRKEQEERVLDKDRSHVRLA